MQPFLERSMGFAERLGQWGYLILFLIVLFECQALFGLFLPGESLLLFAGFLAGQGVFEVDALIVAGALGAIAGDSLSYALGRRFGTGWLHRQGARMGFRERHFERIGRFVAKHGGKSMVFSHFMQLLRPLMPYFAGAHRIGYGRFLVFDAAGCVLWAIAFTLLGFFAGEAWQVVERWTGRAGAVMGALLIVLLVLARLWMWLVEHEAELRAQWSAFVGRPRIVAFRRRFARQIAFVEKRLSPGGYLGLHLTVGAAVVLLAGWWFGEVIDELLERESLVVVDHRLAAWFNSHATDALTQVAHGVTFMGSGLFLTIAAVILGLAFIWRKAWYKAVTVALAVGGGSALNVAVKHLFERPRPVVENPLLTLETYSFPSGHTTGATVLYGLIAVLIVQSATRWRWRMLAPLLAILMIFLVALSRVYLGVHFLSDVIGAMALGIMWLTISITAVEIHRRYRKKAEG